MNSKDETIAVRRREGLRSLLQSKGITPTGLARQIGLPSPNTLFNFMHGHSNSLSLETVERVLAAFPDVTFLELVGSQPRRSRDQKRDLADQAKPMRVYLSVEAGFTRWRPQFELPASQWTSFAPPDTVHVAHELLFGVRVRSTGSELLYPDGTLLLCQRLTPDHGAVVPGARYIVQHRHRKLVQVTVQELRLFENQAWLWPCSSHPEHQQATRLENAVATSPATANDRDAITLKGMVLASWQPEPLAAGT